MIISQLFQNINNYLYTTLSFSEAYAILGLSQGLYSLNFNETGLLLKELLEESYKEGITGLEDIEVDGELITGVFTDQPTPTITRKFSFVVSPGSIHYKLLDPNNPATFSELDKFNQDFLEFAAKKSNKDLGGQEIIDKTGRKKYCTPGKTIACGNRCIDKDKPCEPKSSAKQESLRKEIIKKSKEANTVVTDSSSQIGIRKSKAKYGVKPTNDKPVTTKKSVPKGVAARAKKLQDSKQKAVLPDKVTKESANKKQGKQTEYAKEWETSWKDTPKDLADVLAVIDQPEKITNPTSKVSHYRGGAIHLKEGYKPEGGKTRAEAVWRHEYGHHLDDKIPQLLGQAKFDDFLATIGMDENELDTIFSENSDQNTQKRLKRLIAKEYKLNANINYSELKQEAKRKLSGFEYKTHNGYISASNEGHAAFRSDEKMLVDREKAYQEAAFKEFESSSQEYFDEGLFKQYSSKKRLSKADKLAIGKEIKLMKARTAVNDAVNKLVSNDSSLNQSDVMKEIVSATLEQQYGKDSLAFKLHQEAAKSPKYKAEVGFALLAGSDRPSHLAKAAEVALDAQGKNSHRLVEDLVGSVTKNKAAQGHSDDYYKKDPIHSPNTEAFANIISLYGSGSPLAVEVMENLTPGGYKFTKDILRKVNGNK